MESKPKSVIIGAFESAGDARRAITDLRDAGFSSKNIGILTHDKDGDPDVRSLRELDGNRAGTGAAVGAAAGAGGGALWALGIAAGILPAIGPVIAGGILAALAASAASGAAAGVVVGALAGVGVTHEDAAHYNEAFRQGQSILVIQDDDRKELAQTILTAHNALGRQSLRPNTLAEQIDRRV